MILVTGGAGFIGSCLVKRLNQAGIKEIIIVDSLGVGDKWKNLVGLDFVQLIDKKDFVDLAVEYDNAFETVFHLGACSNTTEKDNDYLYNNNWQYSCDLVQLTRALNPDVRIIYASSAATYGSDDVFDDNVMELTPLNMYGFSKHLFDKTMIENSFMENSVGLKFFNVYGPNEYHKGRMSSVVYKFYQEFKLKGSITLFKSHCDCCEDGEQERDFVYIDDVLDVLMFMKDSDCSGIYNVGTGKARTYIDLARAVVRACGETNDNINFIDMPEDLREQYQYFTEANMDKLKGVMSDYKPHTLEDGIEKYIKHFLDEGYKHYE
jgi:ADP-L-glycero-D-manno-heptose 6-epimerase